MAIPTATSYMGAAELDGILLAHLDTSTIWTAFTVDQKNQYVNWAMYTIDSNQWIGEKVEDDQDNEFPRDFEDEINSGLYQGTCLKKLEDGTEEIFRDLQLAQCEIIIQKIAYDTKDFESVKRANVERFSLGRNALDFKFWDKEMITLYSPVAARLMQCYMLSGNQVRMTARV